ncbi:hypothetical protein TGRH88_009930 [Toxoplasma gondii]|uniref:Uncharacterized protein n=1 Tax=Toxoplasma gondii TaxID=5811 RepID=A0A7J6KFJ3_TOXGO|nr:hypothetical protein TGRH88_009930 [Toxoplasma gondii]
MQELQEDYVRLSERLKGIVHGHDLTVVVDSYRRAPLECGREQIQEVRTVFAFDLVLPAVGRTMRLSERLKGIGDGSALVPLQAGATGDSKSVLF